MKNISKNLIALSFVFGLFAIFGVGSAQAYYNYGSVPTYPVRAMTATEYMYYNGTPSPAYQPVTYKRVEPTPQYNSMYYYSTTNVVAPYPPVAYPPVNTQATTPVVNNYYYGSTPSSASSSTKSTTSSTTKTSTATKNTNTGTSSNSNGMVAAVQPRTNNLLASAGSAYDNNGVYPYCYTGDYSNYGNGSNLTALSMNGSGGFLPSSIWQWILAIMLILAIVVVARMIVKSNPHRDPASTPIH